jgi:hypothetical protein
VHELRVWTLTERRRQNHDDAVALTALIGVLGAVTAGTGKGMAIPSLATHAGLRDNLASTGFALLIALGFAASRGYPLALSGSAIAGYTGGAVIGSALLAAAGVGAGSLIRHQMGAIIAVVAWGLVIELVVGATVTAAGRFLPYTAAAMLARDANGGGMPQIPRGVAALPYPAAIAVLTAIALALGVAATFTTVRRDVT